MKKDSIEVLSDALDNDVVRMPERSYPGLLMQGDELFLLHGEAIDILEELKYNPGSYAFYKAHSIAKNLEDRLRFYLEVCRENGVKLDFRIECSVYDYDEPI